MPRIQRLGSSYVPMGPNYFTLDGAGANTFVPGVYVGTSFDTPMNDIASYGYNTVRLHTNPLRFEAGNNAAPGINNAYWDNVADGIKRAFNTHSLTTILTCGGIPANGIAYPNGCLPDAAISASRYGGYTANWKYTTADALSAQQNAITLILARLSAQGVTAAMLLAIEFTGEIAYINTQYPFNLTSGIVAGKVGSYDMSSAISKKQMMEDELVDYLKNMITTIGASAFPTVPAMIQLAPDFTNTDPTLTFVNQAVLQRVTNAQFYGLSLYPTLGATLEQLVGSFGVTFPLPSAAVMTLETGWFVGMGTPAQSIKWQQDSCKYGIYGSSWYDWLGSDPTYVGMVANSHQYASTLSPTAIGDGCPQLKAFNAVLLDLASQAYQVEIMDANGNPPAGGAAQSVVGGTVEFFQILGPAIAVHNVSFNPEGSILDAIGTLSFEVPLSNARNNTLNQGTRFLLRDSITQIVMGRGIVTKRDIRGTKGYESAQITASDYLVETAWQTVTTGFDTPSPAGEPLVQTGNRLAALIKYPYQFHTDLGTSFDGVAFTSTGSIASSFGNLAKQRFAHWTRRSSSGNTRNIFVGVAGSNTGIVLQGAVPNPTMALLQAPQMRVIEEGSPQISQDYNFVNLVVGYGSGNSNGEAQISLRQLFDINNRTILANGWEISNNTNFVGFQAGYPIYRRIRQDQHGDGFEYFIYDKASYDAFGPREFQKSFSQIGPAGSTPTDYINAAGALYTALVSWLKWNVIPNEVYTVTTSGQGDLRDLAGNKVRLIYRGIARERQPDFGHEARYVNIDVNMLLTVMAVMIRQDAKGVPHADWTLSTNAQYERTDTSVVVAAFQEITEGNFTVATQQMDRELPVQGVTDKTHPLVRTMFGNGGTQHMIEAKIKVEVLAARTNWRPHAHAAPIDAIPHDVEALPHDVNALPHSVNPLSLHFAIGNTASYTDGGVDYDPQPAIHLVNSAPPSGAVPVMFDGTYMYAQGKGKDYRIEANTLAISSTTGTQSGGTVNATTGASTGTGQTGGTVAKTAGGKGGKLVAQPNFATHSDPVTESDGTWDLQQNPAVLPFCQISVGGVSLGVVSGVAVLDATAAFQANGGGATDIQISITPIGAGNNPAGLCEINALIQTRTVISPIGKVGGTI